MLNGTGSFIHSAPVIHIIAEDVAYRAGGLVQLVR